jgi:hypothetical protein
MMCRFNALDLGRVLTEQINKLPELGPIPRANVGAIQVIQLLSRVPNYEGRDLCVLTT